MPLHFKEVSLLDVEYLRKDTRYTQLLQTTNRKWWSFSDLCMSFQVRFHCLCLKNTACTKPVTMV